MLALIAAEEKKQSKRGIFGEGFGTGFGYAGGYGLGLDSYPGLTKQVTVTNNVAVPVHVPVAVPYPVHVHHAVPYPVYKTIGIPYAKPVHYPVSYGSSSAWWWTSKLNSNILQN